MTLTPARVPPSGRAPTPAPTSSAAPSPAPTASAGALLTLAQLTVFFNAVEAKYQSLPQTDPVSIANALLPFVKQQPNVAAANVYEGVLSARFVDGTSWVLTNNRAPDAASSGVPQSTYALPHSSGRRRNDLPSEPGTAFIYGNSVFFNTAIPRGIGAAMSLLGYQTVAGDVTIQNLKAVRNARVLYVDSHGAAFGPPEYEAPVFTFQTATQLNATEQYQLHDDLADGNVGYAQAEDLNHVWHETYFVTPSFIQKYVTMASGGVVFLNTCESAGPTALGTGNMLTAFQQLGAAAYLGWTKEVVNGSADAAAAFFFDRMLGEDKQNTIPLPTPSPAVPGEAPAVTRESPLQRPFSVQAVSVNAQNLGLTTSTDLDNPELDPISDGENSYLDAEISTRGEVLLAPSVTSVAIDEQNKFMRVYGDFGSAPATVMVGTSVSDPNAVALPTVESSPYVGNELDATIPPSGPGSSGYVSVVQGGITSNAVPLTAYTGTVTIATSPQYVSGYSGNLNVQETLTVPFRADLLPSRTSPGKPPNNPSLGLGQGNQLPSGSTGTSAAGGSLSGVAPGPNPQAGASCSGQWSGSGTATDIQGGYDFFSSQQVTVYASGIFPFQVTASGPNQGDGYEPLCLDSFGGRTATTATTSLSSIPLTFPVASTSQTFSIGANYTIAPLGATTAQTVFGASASTPIPPGAGGCDVYDCSSTLPAVPSTTNISWQFSPPVYAPNGTTGQ